MEELNAVQVENPLQTKAVGRLEIKRENDKAQKLTRCHKCSILCSRESLGLSLLVLLLGGGNTYILLVYTNNLKNFYREGVWLFLALGILSFSLVISFLYRTWKATREEKTKDGSQNTSQKESGKPSKIAAAFSFIKLVHKNAFDLNGKYYLVKMYASEIFEHAQQVYTLTNIYVCLIPVEISIVACALLATELLINIWSTFNIGNQETRNRLLLIDIITEICCLVFPLVYTWFSFRIPNQISQMLFIVMYPTISLYLKLHEIWKDYFRIDLERIQQTNTNVTTKKKTFRRSSTLGMSHNREIITVQLNHFPKWLRYGFTLINIGFVLFFVSLMSIHLTTQPSIDECNAVVTKRIWGSCKLKVPFCQNLFVSNCDCAVLELTNYSKKALPGSFGALKSLVRLGIHSGHLKELPQSLGDNHQRLMTLTVVDNKLESIPGSIGKLRNLMNLFVSNNRLTFLPNSVGKLQNLLNLRASNNRLISLPESVGNLQYLTKIEVFNNRLTSLPESIGNWQSLHTLDVFSNHLTFLPDSVGNLQRLKYLWIFNNRLTSLPNSLGNLPNLRDLFAWNNSLNDLPETIGNIESLIVVDVRHNKLVSLPSSVSQWGMVQYLYLAGNPLCVGLNVPSNLNGAIGLCKQQCSVDCPSEWLGRYGCNDNDKTFHTLQAQGIQNVKPKQNSGCNTAACAYDEGECPR